MTANPFSARLVPIARLYRGEAARLRRLAAVTGFHDVRDELLAMAAEYEVLAAQREQLDRHRFGEPLQRPMSAGHPRADERQDNERSRARTRTG